MNFKLTLFIAIALLVVSCSKDTETVYQEADLKAQINVSEKEQAPRAIYDTSERGIYHGVIASGYNQTRGKVWVNVGNNTRYTALIEMVNGDVFHFELDSNDTTLEERPTTFNFKTNEGGFILDVSNPRKPIITEASLYNEEYLANVLKSTSLQRAAVMTGVFSEIGNPLFSGTWNILSNGETDPSGYGGQAITMCMVTWNGRSLEDTTFETYTSPFLCLNSEVIPAVGTFGLNGIMCDDQVSVMGMSTVNWSLSFDTLVYTNYTDCLPRTSGLFTLDNGQGITRAGIIAIDLI